MIARIREPVIVGVLLLGAIVLPVVALAQTDPRVPPPVRRVNLSGPRFGVTYLGGSIVDSLAAYDVDVSPVITQFGWQFERMLYNGNQGVSAVTEWVLLVGGLEQGAFIPSVSWLVGLRGPSGAEFGVGPNVSPAGSALAIAGGVTTRAGAFNLPVNVAVVPGKVGTRVSILVGFTTRSEPSWSRDLPPRVPVVRRPSRPRLPPFPLPGAPIPRCCPASS
jgi:hypothetical protein